MITRKLPSLGLLICLLVLVAGGWGNLQHPQPAFAQSASPDKPDENPALESPINQLLNIYQQDGLQAARDFAAQRDIYLAGDRVQVKILSSNGAQDVEAVRTAVVAVGGQEQSWWGDQVQALIPLNMLELLAAQPGVRFIQQPLRGEPDVTTEGDAAIHAPTYRSVVGTGGAGVKVAILDSGFQGYPGLQSSGELPAGAVVQSFRADAVIDGITDHGAACAEIVYDLAPGASYYLVNYETETEFLNAVDWLETQAVQVVTHSISWFNAGPYDGSSTISQRISTARSNGIFWANSAGNRGRQHWEGNFNGNASGYHLWNGISDTNQLGGGNLIVGTTVRAFLSWNSWPLSSDDYDLYLLRLSGSNWIEVASSKTVQNGSQPPTEQIQVAVPQSGVHVLRVVKVSGSDRFLELFTTAQDLQYRVAAGSVPNAGDSAGAMSAGAVDVSIYNASGLEGFSSRGPTNAAGGGAPDYGNGSRTKPDLVSPDFVSTATYGTKSFQGTSSASPHLAGAAVLYVAGYQLSFGTNPPPATTQAYLENCAEATYDWGTDTDGIKNNDYGAGGLYLCQTPTAITRLNFSASPHQSEPVTLVMVFLAGLALLGSAGIIQHRQRA